MTEPSNKSKAMDEALTSMFGFDRRESIKEDVCIPSPIGCGQPVNMDDFDTAAGRQEYTISGLCPTCQRKVFGSA